MFKLPDHISEKYIAARADADQKRAMFANLDNGDLAASAKFWMAHCAAPVAVEFGGGTYDATFWHIIVPELLRRVKEGAAE
jgi:hypothetical protein